MENLAIIVARDEAGLRAAASEGGCLILEETVLPFASLATFRGRGLQQLGDIDTGQAGFVALATRD